MNDIFCLLVKSIVVYFCATFTFIRFTKLIIKINSMFNNKSVLITGGTGTLGEGLVKTILETHPNVERLIVLSRDEQKQFELSQKFSPSEYPCMRYFIGDVRDRNRLDTAFEGVNIVIHAAAMKHVPIAEYNPMECIKTNVLGAENVINAAILNNVENIVALSTDKAAAPINLYGATKLTSDKLFVAANNIRGKKNIKFSVVRYGNVMGSKGSVVPFFLNKKESGILPITHPDMTRFNITLDEGIEMVLHAVENSWGGEIFIPKIPSFRVTDLALAIASDAKQVITGVRPGEKLHEEMITSSDSFNTYDMGKYYAILPQKPIWNLNEFMAQMNAKLVEPEFSYNSKENKEWLTVPQLRDLIKEYTNNSSHPSA